MITEDLLRERSRTHGNFAVNSTTSQRMKEAMRQHPGWMGLSRTEQEALEMIVFKVTRAISNPKHLDHWNDISGYAELVRRKLERDGTTETR